MSFNLETSSPKTFMSPPPKKKQICPQKSLSTHTSFNAVFRPASLSSWSRLCDGLVKGIFFCHFPAIKVAKSRSPRKDSCCCLQQNKIYTLHVDGVSGESMSLTYAQLFGGAFHVGWTCRIQRFVSWKRPGKVKLPTFSTHAVYISCLM